jgi:hypothetical protein
LNTPQTTIGEKPPSLHETEGSHRSFEKILLEAVDEGLSLLGESSKQTLYFYLENSYKIKRGDISRRIDEFVEAIETIFGTGGRILELLIMKQLYRKVGRNFKYFPKKEEMLFTEYVEAARLSNYCTKQFKDVSKISVSF